MPSSFSPSDLAPESGASDPPDDARVDVHVPTEGPLSPEQAVEAYRRALGSGDDWYDALLATIARWVAADEWVDGELCVYLIDGEAFDWLALATRLVEAAGPLVPPAEAERLLIAGLPPHAETEEEFEQAIGSAKYRAHLNFQYGVVIEELLLLAVEQELEKAGSVARAGRVRSDLEAYEHLYGHTLEELRVQYASETGRSFTGRVSQTEAQAFTYWLSKYRLRAMEPARVASDTKKGMQILGRLEAGRARLLRLAAARERAGIEFDGTGFGDAHMAYGAPRSRTRSARRV